MTRLRAISSPSLCLVALAGAMLAQQQPAWEIESLSTNEGGVVYDLATGWAVAKLGHVFRGSFKALLVDGSGTGYLRTACDYVHLNPVPAKLLGPQDLLLSAEAPGLDGPRSPSASQESAGQAGDCCPPAEGHDASGQKQRWAVAFGRSEQRHG